MGWLSRSFFELAQKFSLTFDAVLCIIHLKEIVVLLSNLKIVLDCILNTAYNSYSEMEKPIQETEKFMLEMSIFVFCLIGCGLTCHHIGKKEGIESTIEHLVDQGMLELDEE